MPIPYKGLSFRTLRLALINMYLYKPDMTEEQGKALEKYVLPMQHNLENPLNTQGGDPAKDTFIEYWIVEDDRLVQDAQGWSDDGGATNETWKTALIDLRFVGADAETWAKAFHHITKRPKVHKDFFLLCRGELFEYIGPIRPVNVDYFGTGNSSIAFDVTVRIKYKESIDLSWLPLEYLSMPGGELVIEGGGENQE